MGGESHASLLAFSILVGPAPPGPDLWPGPALHPMRRAAGAGGGRGAPRSSQTGGAAGAGVSKSQAPERKGRRGVPERRGAGSGERRESLEVRAWGGQKRGATGRGGGSLPGSRELPKGGLERSEGRIPGEKREVGDWLGRERRSFWRGEARVSGRRPQLESSPLERGGEVGW